MEGVMSGCDSETVSVPATALAEVPLFAQLMKDPHVRLALRPVDAKWAYHTDEDKTPTGWNPFRAEIYVATTSAFADWMQCDREQTDLRSLNEGDKLIDEAMFVVHDYLHIWAHSAIRQLRPELDFGVGPITDENFEDHAFALLVSEAVATVGLDYWYLCCQRIEDVLNIGTKFTTLTNQYSERQKAEFERFNPDFAVQDPRFFELIARFYCTGRFPGFGADDVRRSPLLFGWLEHELAYGVSQRNYSRSWLKHFQLDAENSSAVADGRPVACDEDWQVQLLRDLGEMLWAKVKHDEESFIDPRCAPEDTWTAPTDRVDFRFTNVNTLEKRQQIVKKRDVTASQAMWLCQMKARRRCPVGDKEAQAAIKAAANSPVATRWVLDQLPLMDGVEGDGVRDMFFLS